MKKLMMMLAGALMWGATANAQTDIILRGGFATNQFVGDSYEHSEMNPGYNVGIDSTTTLRTVCIGTAVCSSEAADTNTQAKSAEYHSPTNCVHTTSRFR